MNKYLYIVLLCLCSVLFVLIKCRDIPVEDKTKLRGIDYRLFQRTPAWSLAKAVEDEDTKEIFRQINELKIPVDYRDPIYGSTLLNISAFRGKEKSVKALLECGANPNIYSYSKTSRGYNGVICAVQSNNINILKSLLKYKGDPNSREKGINGKRGDVARKSALEYCHSLRQVKLLVYYGANINDGYGDSTINTALNEYMTLGHFECAYFLLQKGAQYHVSDTLDEDSMSNLLYLLRCADLKWDYIKQNGIEYQYKKKIIKFLEQQGHSYKKFDVPSHIEANAKFLYPNHWKEYLEIY